MFVLTCYSAISVPNPAVMRGTRQFGGSTAPGVKSIRVMAEVFPHEILNRLIRAHVDADSAELRFEAVRTGLFNTTFFVDGAPRPLVIRIAPSDDTEFVFYERGMMAQEPAIHRLIRERTSAPVAEIIAYDASRGIAERDYLIMERLPGISYAHVQATREQADRMLEQLGGYMREIHEITAEKYGYLGEHHCMEPADDWASAFRVMWDKLVGDVVRAGYYDSSEEAWVKGLLDRHYGVFDRPVTSRLLHMDIWSQNILVDGEANVTGIVDFDRAVWGDKEIEFAILDFCGISEPAFWRGYGKERDLSPAARIRQAFYLAYELQKYIPIYHFRESDPVTAERYKQQSLEVLRQCAAG